MPKQDKKGSSSEEPRKQECEFRSGPIAGTAIISGATFQNKGLQYANVDGEAMFEGDIVLGPIPAPGDVGAMEAIAVSSIGITGQQFRWPNATIPFEIDPGLPNQNRVTDAIAHWEAVTRIRFVQRTPANAAQHPDFVRFVPGGGCSSMVGRQGGQQNITLGASCTTGNAIHEIGHAVGLWHEQSREDRSAFVNIIFANVDPAMQHNFLQHIADGDDLGNYDYGSIMHYPPKAFSINGQDTIVALQPLPGGVVMGQRSALSAGDIAGVHAMYPAPHPTIKELVKDPITDPVHSIKEVGKDPIVDTIKEVRKDPIIDTIKEVRKDPITDTIKEVRKDPITDTIKEVGRDPIGTLIESTVEGTTIPGGGVTLPGGGLTLPGGGGQPFVVALPNRAGDAAPQQMAAEASAQVEELAQALAMVEQQQAQLWAAYNEAVQTLDALSQG